MQSKEEIIKNEKYQEIFAKYASVIGIDKEQPEPEWATIPEKLAKIEDDKIKAIQLKKEAEEKAKIEAEEKRLRDLTENRQKIIDAYFRKLKDQNLTKYVG